MRLQKTSHRVFAVCAALASLSFALSTHAADSLPSWNDGPAKQSIVSFVDRVTIAAFGNSDGDLQMLQWTTAGAGSRFALIVHHTDTQREWAYDRNSHIGKLDKALDEGQAQGWTVVDMKQDWKRIYPFEQ